MLQTGKKVWLCQVCLQFWCCADQRAHASFMHHCLLSFGSDRVIPQSLRPTGAFEPTSWEVEDSSKAAEIKMSANNDDNKDYSSFRSELWTSHEEAEAHALRLPWCSPTASEIFQGCIFLSCWKLLCVLSKIYVHNIGLDRTMLSALWQAGYVQDLQR
jgi:hypothetical protein